MELSRETLEFPRISTTVLAEAAIGKATQTPAQHGPYLLAFIEKTHLPREFANVTFTRFFETVYLSKWLNLFNKHILRVVGVPPRAIQPTTAASPALDERSKASIWMDPCDSPFWKGKLILEWNKVTFSLREHVIFIHVELVECHSLWFVAKAAAV